MVTPRGIFWNTLIEDLTALCERLDDLGIKFVNESIQLSGPVHLMEIK